MIWSTTKRLMLLVGMATVAGALAYLLYGTPFGERLREDQAVVRAWVEHRPGVAVMLFVLAYAVVGIFALPVWWMQVIGGYCFGLVNGVLLSHAGAVVATLITIRTSGWLLGDWFHRRVEPYHAKLREYDEKLGHNGLLVVTAIRLSHVMPFGISNYLIGMSRIRVSDAIIGTILGGTFSKAFHVAWGVDPGLYASWRFWTGLILINLVLISPLLLRHLRPQWFAKVEVE